MMTDDSTESTIPATPAPATTPDDSAAINGDRSTKSFWVGVGIGSAALAAALLYAKRPKVKRRT